jgi:hypothetical protein
VFLVEAGSRVGQKHRHGFGVHPGQNQRAKLAVQRTHCGQTIDELPYDLLPHHRAQGPGGPAAALVADAAEAGLVLK